MKPVEFTDTNFEAEVLKSEKPVVVDFWATWCGPCRQIAPVIEELASDYSDRVKIGKLDVDNNQQIAIKYGVRSIPTVLFIKNGEVVDKIIGAGNKGAYEQKIIAML